MFQAKLDRSLVWKGGGLVADQDAFRMNVVVRELLRSFRSCYGLNFFTLYSSFVPSVVGAFAACNPEVDAQMLAVCMFLSYGCVLVGVEVVCNRWHELNTPHGVVILPTAGVPMSGLRSPKRRHAKRAIVTTRVLLIASMGVSLLHLAVNLLASAHLFIWSLFSAMFTLLTGVIIHNPGNIRRMVLVTIEYAFIVLVLCLTVYRQSFLAAASRTMTVLLYALIVVLLLMLPAVYRKLRR